MPQAGTDRTACASPIHATRVAPLPSRSTTGHPMTKVKVARASRVFACIAALVGFVTAASAQRPSEEQIAAIRAACRSDFIAHCAGVTPGGAQALMCLREHLASLSTGCQEAVNAASPAAPAAPAAQAPAPPPAAVPEPPAAAPAPAPPAATGRAAAALARMRPTLAQLGIILEACGADMDSRCANATHGPGWELRCLSDNAAALSAGCEQVLVAIASTAPAEPAATAPTPAAAPAPAAPVVTAPPPAAPAVAAPAPAPRARPSREQVIAILRACRGDMREHCAGSEGGPGARIKCLRDNAANLSSGCQEALAAVVSGGAAGPAAAAPAAPPPAMERPARRPVSPREVLFLIRTACGADFQNYCGGVGFGGGRAIGCLRENAANLSPRCRQAFMGLMGGR
jgi:hypothetical protein